MMASSRGRTRSSPRDSKGFGRIGCLLDQAEEHAIMNRAETEDGSYASARNRKLLAGLGLKPGENEYAEPALNPCQTTAYAFFTGDQIGTPSVYVRGRIVSRVCATTPSPPPRPARGSASDGSAAERARLRDRLLDDEMRSLATGPLTDADGGRRGLGR